MAFRCLPLPLHLPLPLPLHLLLPLPLPLPLPLTLPLTLTRRALLRTLETLSDEAVDAQALRVLRAAAAQKGLLQVTEPEGTVAAAPQRPRKTRTRDKAEL